MQLVAAGHSIAGAVKATALFEAAWAPEQARLDAEEREWLVQMKALPKDATRERALAWVQAAAKEVRRVGAEAAAQAAARVAAQAAP